jgi:hypothetical protein
MSEPIKSELTATQQAMLDLALACDLNVSDPGQHAALRQRHLAIHLQREAALYLREVETKIHSRRKFRTLPAVGSAPGGPP